MATLDAIADVASVGITVDRGHKHSSGLTETSLWMKDPVDDAGLARPHTHTSSAMVVPNAMDVPLTRLGTSSQATTGTVSHDLALGSDGNSTKHGVVHVVEQPLVCNDESVPLGAALADILAKLGQVREIVPPPDVLQNGWVDLYYSSLSSLESDLQQHLVPCRSVAPAVD